MPSNDDDVTDLVLEGDAYERAQVTARRVFPVSLRGKIRVAIVTLAASTLLAPALYGRRDYVARVEGTTTLAETLGLTVAVMTLLGVTTTLVVGLALVNQRRVVQRRAPTPTQAKRLVRTEDVLMFFLLQGVAFVAIPVALSIVGLVSTTLVERLYAAGVAVYRPAAALPVDARLVSGVGGVSAVVLSVLESVTSDA